MRLNNMTLETFETFTVRLACGFASVVLCLLLVVLLLLVAGLAGSSFAQDSRRVSARTKNAGGNESSSFMDTTFEL